MTFDKWWDEQDTRFKHSNLREEIHDVWVAVTKIEREACAKLCDAQGLANAHYSPANCAAAIRAKTE